MIWRLLDPIAHRLYAPTLGRGAAHARWHHHIHLIPGVWLAYACDRYDMAIGLTRAELDR